MKPNFSLDLTHTGIRLMDLSGPKPTLVGEASMDDQDFDAKIADLRNRIAEKSDEPLATRLTIPNTEILYTTIDDPQKIPDSKAEDGASSDNATSDTKPAAPKSAAPPEKRDQSAAPPAKPQPAPKAEVLSPEALDKKCDAAVRAALEGMTPYSLDELNYIWHRKKNGDISIAAVAHQTLAEAEGFATQRGFNPVSFVAAPDSGKYSGTPSFGPTELVKKRIQLQNEEAAKRAAEEKAAQEIAEAKKAAAAKSAQAEAPPVKAATQAADNPQKSEEKPQDTAPDSDKPEVKSGAPKSGIPTKGKDDTSVQGKTSAQDKTPPAEKTTPPSKPELTGTLGIATATLPDTVASLTGSAKTAEASKPPRRGLTPVAQPNTSAAETPKIGISRPDVAPLKSPPQTNTKPSESANEIDDVPPMPVSFASRRSPSAGAKAPPPPAAKDVKVPAADSPTGSGKTGATTVPTGAAGEKDSRLARLAARFQMPGNDASDIPPPPPARRSGALRPGAAKTPDQAATPALRGSASDTKKPTAGAPRVKPASLIPGSADAAASLTPVTDSNGKPLSSAMRANASTHMATGRKLNEAEAMTVFGARSQTKQSSGMSPLIIGLAVAAILAAGVWGAVFLLGDDDISNVDSLEGSEGLLSTPEPSEISSPVLLAEPSETTPSPIAPQLPDATQRPNDTAPSPGVEIAALPDTGADTDTATSGTGGNLPDTPVGSLGPAAPIAPEPEAQPITPVAPEPPSRDPLERALSDETRGRYATTGIWQAAPEEPDAPGLDRLDDLYIASADPVIRSDDSASVSTLPEFERPNTMASPIPPAPPGTTFQLDDRGLVEATPTGALSPNGVRITAGSPAATPPTRPNRPATLTPSPETQPDVPRIRPPNRPDSLVPEREQTQLSPQVPDVTRAALIRPMPRAAGILQAEPQESDAQEQTETAEADASTALPQAPLSTPIPRSAPATLVALALQTPTPPAPAEIAKVTEPEEPISPYAIAASRLPKEKPRDFDKIVSRSRTAAPKAAEPTVTRVASAAAIVQPRIPSKTSVTRQATIKNALKLGRVNLIGVYGSSSNRRALLRLSSGKFVKVKIGDRVDGGRVASIGQSDLTYTKSGRRLTLSMPNG